MKKTLLNREKDKALHNKYFSEGIKDIKLLMDRNDQGLMDIKKILARNYLKPLTKKVCIKYYMSNNKRNIKGFSGTLKDSDNNIIDKTTDNVILYAIDRITKKENSTICFYSPLRLVKTIMGRINHLTNYTNVKCNSPVQVFEAYSGKVHLKYVEKNFLQELTIRAKQFSYKPKITKYKVLKKTSSKEKKNENIKVKNESGSTETKDVSSNFKDDIDELELLSARFHSMESYLVDEVIFPSMNAILKGKNEVLIYDSSKRNLFKNADNSPTTFKEDYLYDIVKTLLADWFRTMPESSDNDFTHSLPLKINTLVENERRKSRFQMVKIYDESLAASFLKDEDIEFELAIQYSEGFIIKSKTYIERSNSGNKKIITEEHNRAVIEYYGSFGFIDGIHLIGISEPLPVLSSLSDFSESHESFQALSHMCHLNGLLTRTSIFKRPEPGGMMIPTCLQQPLESLMTSGIFVTSNGLSDTDSSVDDNLIHAFKDRVNTDIMKVNKSKSTDSVESDS